MESDLFGAIDFGWAVLLLFCNCLFAAAEYSLLRTIAAELKSADGKSKPGSKLALWLLNNFDLSFTLAQVGRGTTTLLLGWFGIEAFRALLVQQEAMRDTWDQSLTLYYLAMIAGIVLLLVVPVVAVGLIGKSIALAHPEKTLRLLSLPMFLLSVLFKPLIYVARGIANAVLAIFNTEVPPTSCRIQGNTELSLLFRERGNQGVFDKDEEKLIRGVVGFSDTIVREVMTPRTDLVAIEAKSDLSEVLRVVIDSGFSRFPVRGRGIDDVVGMLVVKDLLPILSQLSAQQRVSFSLKQVMRKPYFIPGTKPVDELLNEFRKRKIHMAIVLDEHGGVDGVVTLEDLLEVIVGDIYDESDTEDETEIVEIENGDLQVAGGVLVTDLNERYHLLIPEGDYDTIAGFIFTCLGRMPKVGDQVVIDPDGEISTGMSSNPAPASAAAGQQQPVSLASSGSALSAVADFSDQLATGHPGAANNAIEVDGKLNGNGHDGAAASSTPGYLSQYYADISDTLNDQMSLVIAVDKIESHRIESVKIRRVAQQSKSESQPVRKAS